ncbi:MAG: hypothetical protein KGV51_06830 [Moraxellaceae bacterium]|nr:hypothetical protein [Moraxellaceae bacterium]
MKVMLFRFNRKNKAGVSKAGNPYHIDETVVTVGLSANSEDSFGFKPKNYVFGDHKTFEKFMALKSHLPCEVDIDTDVALNEWDMEVDIITDIKTPLLQSKQVK